MVVTGNRVQHVEVTTRACKQRRKSIFNIVNRKYRVKRVRVCLRNVQRRTAVFAIRTTADRGSSYCSIPSRTPPCWVSAWSDASIMSAFRGIFNFWENRGRWQRPLLCSRLVSNFDLCFASFTTLRPQLSMDAAEFHAKVNTRQLE